MLFETAEAGPITSAARTEPVSWYNSSLVKNLAIVRRATKKYQFGCNQKMLNAFVHVWKPQIIMVLSLKNFQ
jgi:hypothetical protein